jgi:hypothetical protein
MSVEEEGTPPSQRTMRRVEAYLQRRDDYGLCLVLVIATIISLAVADDVGPGRALAVSLSGATLIAVLVASGARPRALRILSSVVVVSVAGAVLALVGLTPDVGDSASGIVGVALATVAPLVIIRRIVLSRVITFRLVLGALCVYLMIGLAYTYLFPLLAHLLGRPFFVQTTTPELATYLYFSYTTLATVGYGDYTAASSLGRMVAISEALVGQLYLVSAVALLVGSIGRGLRAHGEPRHPDHWQNGTVSGAGSHHAAGAGEEGQGDG